jgi:hypothetical protein
MSTIVPRGSSAPVAVFCYLENVRLICGTECKEYVALKEVIDGTLTY